MSTSKPCAAANCECEDFLPPKTGNPKRCADMECNHPLGAHQGKGSQIATSSSFRATEESVQTGTEVITLDEDDDPDIQLSQHTSSSHGRKSIPSSTRTALVVSSHSRHHPPATINNSQLSFANEVNIARQKAGSKALRDMEVRGSRFAPVSLSTTLHTTILVLKPLQVKTTIWTREDGAHMIKENNTQWWDFPLEETIESFNL
ncbi:hypothetical protein L873DRAFT_1849498 [Choiromyces venosus 120613-1]|uniref:Uncharacterized protein n=1 Tax=Choiromyces venosus 120613-1 TaxID=1336337 RepID=A0A3N4IVR9_9PEZI|nr:hypothetical protein L873DRAFT_1849498 [Choiromyces venosus 120613-1]